MGYGVADFAGGVATRSLAARRVAARSQLWGLLVLVPAALLTRGRATPHDIGLGMAAGIAGALGLVAYLRALAIGPMGVVSPIAAIVGTLVPVTAGVALGERPGLVADIGIAIALGAVLLSTTGATGGHRARPGARHRGPALACVAGCGFGAFYCCMHATAAGAGLWPLIAARAGSLTLLWIVPAVWARGRVRAARGTVAMAATVGVSGILDMAANIAYLAAAHRGLLTVTGVVVSLYPIVVVLLARIVLREQLSRRHQVAAAAALTAAALLTV